MEALRGVVMELRDLAAPLLEDIVETSDPEVAFKGASVAVLVGAIPRRKGEARANLLGRNLPIFKAQGLALRKVASRDVRVLVVGNPANTNAYVVARTAELPPEQVTALTMLDHNRARAQVALRVGAPVNEVRGICVWGNHSDTQYPDVIRAEARGRSVLAELGGYESIAKDLIPVVQKRGGAVVAARGLSSALSAAKAIADHLRAWRSGSADLVSMAVPSNGEYDIPKGIYYSYPVRCKGAWNVDVETGLEIDDFSREYLDASAVELAAEMAEAKRLLEPEMPTEAKQ